MSTGRYWIVDFKSGRRFLVEPVGSRGVDFGDSIEQRPRHDGAIRESESVINETNGFRNIGYASNPMDFVTKLLEGGEAGGDEDE